MKSTLIKSATIVNEGQVFVGDVLIRDGRIEQVGVSVTEPKGKCEVIDATGLHLLPGCIDDQVHFREPGLTHKADLYTESRAAVAGGITSFMEMPNTVPNTLTQELLQQKYDLAAQKSPANYSFFMGVSNDNAEEVLRTDPEKVCGIKIFMGSSTGNMLVDDDHVLSRIFANTGCLIATHCEDEATVKRNLQLAIESRGNFLNASDHPFIRSEEACYLSSSRAVALAKKHNTRLHILHISTAKELSLFDNTIPLDQKRITSEACIHHLWFSDADYATLGNLIKWNPAVKTVEDRDAILKAVIDNRIDVIATDHAPHTLGEKMKPYTEAPSGGPLVQHALLAMLELCKQGKIELIDVVRKMSHDVARCFRLLDRGYIREGYFADLVLVDMNKPMKVDRTNLLYKCGWSPFEGVKFGSTVVRTLVNGHIVWNDGRLVDAPSGSRLQFDSVR
ncbi:MAG: dihydroorotase [Bacteroidota bacterium]|jgi:dihydroorotase